MLSDIEIAQSVNPIKIERIAKKLGINSDDINCYGKYKAKLPECVIQNSSSNEDGKLVLVTAINPTPAGEGKTTTSVGLGDALSSLGYNTVIALREPSLGPVFGIKGGAAGGGYSQVIPMEDINLHFTGDMHAITTANNLLCAMLDNHIHQGNELGIDTRKILINRCLDMNDRELRNIVAGLGGKINGVPREDGFIITVASEVMAILCLAENIDDLKEKLGNILVAYTFEDKPIFAKDLKANNAMAAVLKDAIQPNLVQTLEGTPTLIHGGPFANIAHGCNSVRATKLALKLGDYCVTEAGFGSDLGAEKFMDIKCRKAGIKPNTIVLVATVRALKYNGGADKSKLTEENIEALKLGLPNLEAHIDNMQKYGVPVIVCINKFSSDTCDEISLIKDYCANKSVECEVNDTFSKGSQGGEKLAQKVVQLCEMKNTFHYMYESNDSIEDKIQKLCKKIYGTESIIYSKQALKSMINIKKLDSSNLPICVAKTQYSLSDDATLLGRPKDFTMNIRDVKLSNGAGFIVVYMGNIMTMPGLPKKPAAFNIDVDSNGIIKGLF